VEALYLPFIKRLLLAREQFGGLPRSWWDSKELQMAAILKNTNNSRTPTMACLDTLISRSNMIWRREEKTH
jgi:hypothetical protein